MNKNVVILSFDITQVRVICDKITEITYLKQSLLNLEKRKDALKETHTHFNKNERENKENINPITHPVFSKVIAIFVVVVVVLTMSERYTAH